LASLFTLNLAFFLDYFSHSKRLLLLIQILIFLKLCLNEKKSEVYYVKFR